MLRCMVVQGPAGEQGLHSRRGLQGGAPGLFKSKTVAFSTLGLHRIFSLFIIRSSVGYQKRQIIRTDLKKILFRQE